MSFRTLLFVSVALGVALTERVDGQVCGTDLRGCGFDLIVTPGEWIYNGGRTPLGQLCLIPIGCPTVSGTPFWIKSFYTPPDVPFPNLRTPFEPNLQGHLPGMFSGTLVFGDGPPGSQSGTLLMNAICQTYQTCGDIPGTLSVCVEQFANQRDRVSSGGIIFGVHSLEVRRGNWIFDFDTIRDCGCGAYEIACQACCTEPFDVTFVCGTGGADGKLKFGGGGTDTLTTATFKSSPGFFHIFIQGALTTIGDQSPATVLLKDLFSIQWSNTVIGHQAPGRLEVDGVTFAQWLSGHLVVGGESSGFLDAKGASFVQVVFRCGIAETIGSTGILQVRDNSRLLVEEPMWVGGGPSGAGGTGLLRVFGGGRVDLLDTLQVYSSGRVETPIFRLTGGFSAGANTVRAGSLSIEIGPGGTPAIEASDRAHLGSTLRVTLAPGFNPPVGTTIDLLRAPHVIGRFDEVILPDGPCRFRLDYDPDAVRLVVVQPDPADLNCDGRVNGLDLMALVELFGLCPGCDDCPGDMDGDCHVDLSGFPCCTDCPADFDGDCDVDDEDLAILAGMIRRGPP